MSKFRLLEISSLDKCIEIYSGYEIDVLVASGEKMSKKNPDTQHVIVDEQGYLVWPETHQTAKEKKQEVYDMNLSKSNSAALPPSCLECSVKNCRLPYSKVLPMRKLAQYSYKRHPKCVLEVVSGQNDIRS